MDVPCAVSRDLAEHQAREARLQRAAETFDDEIADVFTEEIDRVVAALEELKDAVRGRAESMRLGDSYQCEFLDSVQRALFDIGG